MLNLIILLIIQIGIAIAVGNDAAKRFEKPSEAPFFWFIGTLLIPLLFIPYLIVRPPRDT